MSEARTRVYEALLEITADGWPATVREIQAKLGAAGPATIHHHLIELEREGVIQTNPRWPSRRGGWRPK